jgi:hypothetical protein
MATGAGLVEWEQTHGKKKAKYALTSTGLLMEGVEESFRGGLTGRLQIYPDNQPAVAASP